MVPFQRGIEAGAKLIMSGHFAIPALTGQNDLPATLSRAVMHDFLRHELGFQGVMITDALDMKAITQGAGQLIGGSDGRMENARDPSEVSSRSRPRRRCYHC